MLENTQRKAQEQQLAHALQQGDQQALGALYDAYAPVLLGLITRITGPAEMAESVLQETFLAIWHYRANYQPSQTGLLTWMIMLAKETALNAIKTGRIKHFSDTPENRNFAAQKNEISTSLLTENPVATTFCQLEPTERAALDLIFLKGYTIETAAAALNVSPATLTTNLKMAIRHIGATTAS